MVSTFCKHGFNTAHFCTHFYTQLATYFVRDSLFDIHKGLVANDGNFLSVQ